MSAFRERLARGGRIPEHVGAHADDKVLAVGWRAGGT